MRYFYARVSTKEQNLDRQLKAAKEYPKPIDRIFSEKESGKNFNRPAYQEMKSLLKPGDEVIVHALDRLSRNKEETKAELKWFKDNHIIFRCEDLPTTMMELPQELDWVNDMMNNIILEVYTSIAEHERVKIRQRQREGIEAMKARGDWDKYGRPKMELPEFMAVYTLWESGEISKSEAARRLGVSRATFDNKSKAYTA